MNSKQKILNIKAKLFAEKGYQKTSMQDIVMQDEMIQAQLHELEHNIEADNAKDKIIQLLMQSIQSQDADDDVSDVLKSPDFILKYMQDCINQSAPAFGKIIKEGTSDGSFQTEYPEEIAEAFLLLLNIWCNSYIFPCDDQHRDAKKRFIQHMMKTLGVDIVTDEFIERF